MNPYWAWHMSVLSGRTSMLALPPLEGAPAPSSPDPAQNTCLAVLNLPLGVPVSPAMSWEQGQRLSSLAHSMHRESPAHR